MNSKTLNLIVRKSQTIPLYVTGLTQGEMTYGYPSLTPNGYFNVISSGSFTDWTYDNTYWTPTALYSISGSSAKTTLQGDNIKRTMTSGSFAITGGEYYRASAYIKSEDGFAEYYLVTNPADPKYQEISAFYGAEINWYNTGNTLVGTETIADTSGEIDWTNYIKVVQAPASATKAKFVISAKSPVITYYMGEDNVPIIYNQIQTPVVYFDNTLVLTKNAKVLLKRMDIRGGTELSYDPKGGVPNKVENHSFELISSGSIASWVGDTQYWFRLHPKAFSPIQGNFILATSDNNASLIGDDSTYSGKHLPADGIIKTVTSASFPVTTGELYNISLWLKSDDGKAYQVSSLNKPPTYNPPVYYDGFNPEGYNPDSGSASSFQDFTPQYISASIVYYNDYEYDAGNTLYSDRGTSGTNETGDKIFLTEPLRASYSTKIDWYSGSVLLSSDYIMKRTGGTPWREFAINKYPPATADNAKIVISASCPYMETINTDSGNLTAWKIGASGSVITRYPAVYVDYVRALVPSHQFQIFPEMPIVGETDITSSSPLVDMAYYTLIISASSVSGSYTDCSGKTKDKSFSMGSSILTAGCDEEGSTSTWKSWIPFTCDFSELGAVSASGMHIVSACAVVTAASTQEFLEETPCKLKIGFDKQKNPPQPETWEQLNARVVQTPWSGSVLETWEEGVEYNINITNSAKKLFGQPDGSTDGITWNNGNELAVIFSDFGSDVGAYRTIVSEEGYLINNDYSPVRLKLTVTNNDYTDNVLDTYMTSTSSSQVNYNSERILVGSPQTGSYIQRGLMNFNFKSNIPANAIVTSASLCLHQLSEQATSASYIYAYRMLTEWDLYTSTWRKKNGTNLWDTAGCDSSTEYLSGSYIGRLMLPTTSGSADFTINLDAETTGSWINGGHGNYGILLKMGAYNITEKNNAHAFASSQYPVTTMRPYLKVEYTSSGSYFVTTIKQTKNEKTSMPITKTQTSYNKDFGKSYNYKIGNGSKRYLLVLEETEDGDTRGYHTSMTITNTEIPNSKINFTRIKQSLLGEVQVVAFGVAIPDSWDGGTECTLAGVYEKSREPQSNFLEFKGVSPTGSVYDSDTSYNNAGVKSGSIAIDVKEDGYVVDIIGIKRNDRKPSAGSTQSREYCEPTGKWAISNYASPRSSDTTTTMSWKFDSSGYAQLVVSLKPYKA